MTLRISRSGKPRVTKNGNTEKKSTQMRFCRSSLRLLGAAISRSVSSSVKKVMTNVSRPNMISCFSVEPSMSSGSDEMQNRSMARMESITEMRFRVCVERNKKTTVREILRLVYKGRSQQRIGNFYS